MNRPPSYNTRWLFPLLVSISLIVAANTPFAQSSSPRTTLSPPPSVELTYYIRLKYAAMSIGGHSSIVWKNQGNRYTIQTSAYANLLGKMLDTTSSGHRDAYFLLPERFKEKRRRKEETQTNFDYARNTLTLSEKQKTLPLEKGLQDRASVVWQLVSMARAAPERFRAGNSLRIPVINRSRIDTWEIRVVGSETLVTPLGNLETIHLEKRAAKGKNVEIWLTPDHDWYPAQLIITDEKDNYRLEQVIRKITPVTTP